MPVHPAVRMSADPIADRPNHKFILLHPVFQQKAPPAPGPPSLPPCSRHPRGIQEQRHLPEFNTLVAFEVPHLHAVEKARQSLARRATARATRATFRAWWARFGGRLALALYRTERQGGSVSFGAARRACGARVRKRTTQDQVQRSQHVGGERWRGMVEDGLRV